MYNYKEVVFNDVVNYLKEEYSKEELKEKDYDDIYDVLWVTDCVTGNGSGSYTFNTVEAEENLAGNWNLLVDAAKEFGIEPIISNEWRYGPEWWDVTIRCRLLGEVLREAIEKVLNEE